MIFVGQKSSFWKSDEPRKRGLNLSMLKDGCFTQGCAPSDLPQSSV